MLINHANGPAANVADQSSPAKSTKRSCQMLRQTLDDIDEACNCWRTKKILRMRGREDSAHEHPVRRHTNGLRPSGDGRGVIRAGQCSIHHAIKYIYAN